VQHPSIVAVLQTFEEARGGSLAFVTERIKCSLANALGDRRGITAAASRAAAELRELRKLEQYEVSRGVVGVTEALQYVHTISRRVHMNLAPEAIFLAPSGQWKLAGMSLLLTHMVINELTHITINKYCNFRNCY
jgi:hypothetical protein